MEEKHPSPPRRRLGEGWEDFREDDVQLVAVV
jgi:hypothetical protein